MLEFFRGLATIFMLHRVYPLENHRLCANESMKVTPEYLERFIIEAKQRDYTFISLDSLYNLLHNNVRSTKNIVITLDDGYVDNYTHAYQIFKKYNVPFTVYVPTSFPDYTAVIWWYIIEDLIIQNETITLSNGCIYHCKTMDEKNIVFMELVRKIKSLPARNFKMSFRQLFRNYTIDERKKVKELSLSWKQIKEMAEDPLVTIGAHTVNHPVLKLLPQRYIRKEILNSKCIIESQIHKEVLHFSYPFGTRNEVGSREFRIVKNLGFVTVTTTRFGNIYRKHKNHTEALPRIMLTEDFSWHKFKRQSLKGFIRMLVFVL